MVLCMRLDMTSPTTTLRRPDRSLLRTLGCPCRAIGSGMLPPLRLAVGKFLLTHNGFDAGDILAQTANFLQALCLSHVELELQLEELVSELMLLMTKLDVGEVADFLRFHKSVLNQFSVAGSHFSVGCPISFLCRPTECPPASQTWCAGAACAMR